MTQWSPTDKAASIVLSGSNLIATQDLSAFGSGGFGSAAMVRADIGSSSSADDWYFEIHIDAITLFTSSQSIEVGLSNSSQNLNTEFDSTNGIGFRSDGVFYGAGGTTTTGSTFTTGDIIGVHKKTSGDIDFSVNGTVVHTAVSSSVPSGTVKPSVILIFPGDQITANFGDTSFVNLPSGASGWGAGVTAPPATITPPDTLPSLGGGGTGTVTTPPTAVYQPPTTFAAGVGYFPDTIKSVLAGSVVRCDLLVFFDFATTPMRLWQGFGTLRTNDGKDWYGIGQLGQIGDLESSIGGTSPQANFVLSGVDPTIIADALAAQDEIYGRDVNVYMQFFDANFNCLDNPYTIWAGIMDVLRIKQVGTESCTVELSAETIFARRSLPPLGNLTDREQQMLYPGDTGLSLIPSLISKVAIWPVILPGYP